jgi:hypothetical protein
MSASVRKSLGSRSWFAQTILLQIESERVLRVRIQNSLKKYGPEISLMKVVGVHVDSRDVERDDELGFDVNHALLVLKRAFDA